MRRVLVEYPAASESYNLQQIRLVASMGLVFLYAQLFYWMRTSNNLA